ncbi:MAG: hypothetical protein EP311_07870 [Cytophagales bacterium]|uniref:Uncharacterized protein n=1 Tax=Algoriphagus taiwanensis TaxID=1445656 RepID=A0ABQ6PWL7_9BACT|nr:MAG: hypothetical protein EP311_07870 [Cytophagales bacterium]GMQ32357.1 hypothetical protein Ataiwa_06290 [Algoriphagus taiwanensis]
MDFSSILNLVIGLVFIYFLIALACSTIQELIAHYLDLRAENLEKWLKDTFRENNLGEKFLNHRLIDGLTAQGRRASYIPSKVFSGVLLDLVNKKEMPYDLVSLKESVGASDLPEDLKRRLLQSISEAKNGLEDVRRDIEGWFNDCMDRISGTYKKKAQFFIVIISTAVVIFLNVDSINIIQYLYNHPAESAALADRISENIENLDPNNQAALPDSLSTEAKIDLKINELKEIQASLDATKLPFGWQKGDGELSFREFTNKILGLIFSIIAGIVGAPFWFQTLNKLVNLRGAGAKPQD